MSHKSEPESPAVKALIENLPIAFKALAFDRASNCLIAVFLIHVFVKELLEFWAVRPLVVWMIEWSAKLTCPGIEEIHLTEHQLEPAIGVITAVATIAIAACGACAKSEQQRPRGHSVGLIVLCAVLTVVIVGPLVYFLTPDSAAFAITHGFAAPFRLRPWLYLGSLAASVAVGALIRRRKLRWVSPGFPVIVTFCLTELAWVANSLHGA